MNTQNKHILAYLKTPEGSARIASVLSQWVRGEQPAHPKGSRITQARVQWAAEQRRKNLWKVY